MPNDQTICLQLTADQALVLFEWLARMDEREAKVPFDDPAEERVLWLLEGQLESSLVAPLDPKYRDLLAAARRAVTAQMG
jgi:hypothetical protein